MPADRVRALLGAEGLAAPDDVVTWWGWHDGAEGPAVPGGPGIAERPETTLVAGWHVLSVEDAVRIRSWTLADYARAGAPKLVPSTWVPVLQFTGTPFLAADAGAAGGAPPLYIVDGGAGLPEPTPTPHFRSLAELVSVVIGLFDDGVVMSDPDEPHVPTLRGAPDTEEVRRLTRW